MRRSTKTKPFAVNPQTLEVYEAVDSDHWLEKLTAWRESIRSIRDTSSSAHSVIPSPLPLGHIMFDSSTACDVTPAPIWTDGARCFYAGQRVHWQMGDGRWNSGEVLGVDTFNPERPMLDVRAYNGVVLLDPLNL